MVRIQLPRLAWKRRRKKMSSREKKMRSSRERKTRMGHVRARRRNARKRTNKVHVTSKMKKSLSPSPSLRRTRKRAAVAPTILIVGLSPKTKKSSCQFSRNQAPITP